MEDTQKVSESIRARLEAAERVCVLFTWTPARHGTDREKALHELWRHWVEVSGRDCSPEANPDLSDDLIADLARRRDETRERTLAARRASSEAVQHDLP